MDHTLPQTTDNLPRAKDLLNRATIAYRRAEFQETQALIGQAIELITALTPSPDRALLLDRAYRRLAEAQDRLSNFEAAEATLESWAQATERREGQVDILAMRVRLAYRRGDFESALRFADEGASMAQASGYAAGLAAIMRYRADILWMRGEAEQALTVVQQAIAIYERLDDLEGRARTLNTAAAIYHIMGRFYDSIKHALRAIRLLEALGDQIGLSIVYTNIGESYQQLYAMQTALFYHEQALNMVAANVSPDLLRNLGVDLVAVGRVEEGLARLLEALETARHEGDKDTILQCLHSLAEAVFNIGQANEAKMLALQLLTEAQPLNASRHIIRAVLILGYCAWAEGDEVTAREYFHEGFMTAQRASDKSMIWQTHAALGDMLAASQPELAQVHNTIAAEMVNSILLSIEDEELQGTFRSAPPVAKVLRAVQSRT